MFGKHNKVHSSLLQKSKDVQGSAMPPCPWSDDKARAAAFLKKAPRETFEPIEVEEG